MKQLLIIIGVVFAVIASVAAVAVPTLISTNLARSEIAEQISGWAGVPATIGSEPVVRLFPSVGVEVRDISLPATRGAKDTPTIAIPTLEASVRILPLLFGHVEIESLTLIDPVVHTVATDTGSHNWPASCVGSVARLGDMSTKLGSTRHGDIVLRDGAIGCLDRRTNRVHSITAANLRFKWSDAAAPARLVGTFRWRAKLVELDAELDDPREAFTGSGSRGRATFTVQPISPAGVEPFGISVGPNSTFGPLQISGKVSADQDSVTLSDATFETPDGTAEGDVTLELGGERPMLFGSLAFSKLDLGRYAGDLLRFSASELLALPVSTSWVGYADLDLTAHAAEIDLGGLEVTETDAKLTARDGQMKLTLERAEVGDGHLESKITISTAEEGVALRLSGRLDDIVVADITEALWVAPVNRLVGLGMPLAGTAKAQFNLSAAGGTVGELVKSLEGRAVASVRDGSINGVDIVSALKRLTDGNTVIAGGKAPFIPVAGRTQFTRLTVDVNLGSEAARAERIRLTGDLFEVEVSGEGDLERGELEAWGVASLFASESRLSRLNPVVQLPFGVGGTMLQPVLVPGIPQNRNLSRSSTLPPVRVWSGPFRDAQNRSDRNLY